MKKNPYENTCYENAWILNACIRQHSVTQGDVLDNVTRVLYLIDNDPNLRTALLQTLRDMFSTDVYTAMLKEACDQSRIVAVDVLLKDGRAQPDMTLVARATKKGQLAVVQTLMRDARLRTAIDPVVMRDHYTTDPRVRNYWTAYINEREAERRRNERKEGPESMTKRNKWIGAQDPPGLDWAKWFMRYLRTGPYDLVTFLSGLAKRPYDEVDKVLQWIQTKPVIAEKFVDETFVDNLLTNVDIIDFKAIVNLIIDKRTVRDFIESKIHVLTSTLWLRLANAAATQKEYDEQMRYTLRIMYGEHRRLFNVNAVSVLLTAVRSNNAAAIHVIMHEFTLFLPRNDGLIYEAIEADNRRAFDALLEYPTMHVSMNELTRALFRGRVYMMQQLLRRIPLDEKKLLSLIELTADEDMKAVLRDALPGAEPAPKKRDINSVCLACATLDATVTCQACGVAQYCGVTCAQNHWDVTHQFNCLTI